MLVALGLLASWSRGVGPLLATVVAIPIGVATCFLLSRAGTAAFSAVLSSRRFRDFAFVGLAGLGLVFGVGANLVGGLLGQGVDRFRTLLSDAATLASWTPFGWAWAVPADVASGRWLLAGLRLLLAVAFVVLLWLVWGHYLGKRLTEPLEAARGAGRMRGGDWVDRLYPASPVGGVAARTLRYWRRDPRYVAGIAGFLIGPVILMVAQLANPDGQPLIAAFAPTLLCWLIGSSMAQDLSYDGSAIWVHASSGVRGLEDRLGRVLSTLTVFVPVVAVLTVIGLALSGEWSVWLSVLSISVTLTLVSIGVGAFVGTLWQWPAPPPGANPFQKGTSGGLPSLAAFGVTSTVSLLLAAPTIAPGDRVLLGRVAGLARSRRRGGDRLADPLAGRGPRRRRAGSPVAGGAVGGLGRLIEGQPPGRTCSTRNPLAVPVRTQVKPCSTSQPARVSAPKFLATTRWATPVGVSRASQVSSRSCSAALPIRIGGLDQSSSYLVSAGTWSGRCDPDLPAHVQPVRVVAAERQRAVVHVDGVDHGPGAGQGQAERDRPPAAAEVQDPRRSGRGRDLAQQDGRAPVQAVAGEDAVGGLHGDRRPNRSMVTPGGAPDRSVCR